MAHDDQGRPVGRAFGCLRKDGAGNVSVEQEELLEDAQLLSVRPAQHPVKDVQQCAHCVGAPQLLPLVADWICVQIVALDRNS